MYYCKACGGETHTLHTDGARRRRECLKCGDRFTTLEIAVLDYKPMRKALLVALSKIRKVKTCAQLR